MIIDHQKFDFGEKCLIEKVIIQAPFRFMVDFPNDACFIYFEEGNTKVNSPYEQVPVAARESVLLKCGTYFSDLLAYATSDRYEIIVVHLPKNILWEIYKHDIQSFPKSLKKSRFIQKLESQELVREYIKGLHFYFKNPEVVSDELLALKLKELILLLLQTKNAESVSTLFQQLFSSQQIDIRDVVNTHIFSNLSVEDLAALSHLSVSTFKRHFKEIFDDTPANYIKAKRLERAKQLLSISNMTISEIAYETCFNDVAHLSKSFKSVYNISPSAYRQKNS